MAYCINCGQQLPPEAKACPGCGTPVTPKTEAEETVQPTPTPAHRTDYTADFDPQDIADNKLMAALAYLGWLILIPLLATPAKDSPFVRFHVNQGLILLVCILISGVLSAVCIGVITGIICVVLLVIGIVNALNGRAIELPIVGKYRIMK